MSDSDKNLERVTRSIRSRRKSLRGMITALIVALLCLTGAVLYLFHNDRNQQETIALLSTALEQQKQQFEDCADVDPALHDPLCEEPIAPPAESIVEGRAGPRGAQGPEGAEGQRGPRGPQGVPGPLGPMGLHGIPGVNGVDGSDGRDGTSGERGPAGADGAVGPSGEQGPTGPEGPAGPAGVNGRSVKSTQCVGEGRDSYWQTTYSDGAVENSGGPCKSQIPLG